MNNLKKLIAISAVMASVYLFSNPNIASADIGGGNCKWKQIDCPGWFNGEYEACLTNGDGNVCTCGNVTRDCGASTE